MNLRMTLCLICAALRAGSPLAVVQVVREGLPPYEDADRRYRLEGDGCAQLSPGEVVLLVRPREPRSLGQLEVVSANGRFALARLRKAGATFPMKGDLAVPREPLRTLPALPGPAQPLAVAVPLPPPSPSLAVPPPGAAHREPVFFLPEQSYLTPGAKAKLKAWVAAWGVTGRWVLARPVAPDSVLAEARVTALRTELGRLGVPWAETGTIPLVPPGKFPAIYVILNPN